RRRPAIPTLRSLHCRICSKCPMAKPAAVFGSIRSGTRCARTRVSKSSVLVSEGKLITGAMLSRQAKTCMKTAVLFCGVALWCVPCLAKAQSTDERLRAIYTEEWKWRLEQFSDLEGVEKPGPDRLPRGDPATQETRLRFWQDVLHKLDDVPRAQLSPQEQINYDVYRPEIENFVADQKFHDYEMPANSDSAFWSDLGYTARRPFKTLTDYKT